MAIERYFTVALHFLGVPEEGMKQPRRFSVVHTLNIWLRIGDEEGLFAGEVIDPEA
ncbi:MAG: hypothetical protein RI841_04190 [Halomonas sp.]|uniref:hypothetical protein n=1 Tax=Halomonas sp. TaxID=1486246 RepID=UPI00286FCF29|nr:hypothetical protein [Halomonas sp.]MDR9438686.1 hypothetical protein [Halomonas sp.]